MKRWHLGVALGLTALAGMALAAGQKAGADAQFDMMDSNHDGKVSADEHAAGAKRMFDTMDANHDGKVTAAEMDAAQPRIAGHKAGQGEMSSADKIKVVDTDGDGVLTAEEHAAGSRAMFERMDTNKDGMLSKAEMAAGHAKMLRKTGG